MDTQEAMKVVKSCRVAVNFIGEAIQRLKASDMPDRVKEVLLYAHKRDSLRVMTTAYNAIDIVMENQFTDKDKLPDDVFLEMKLARDELADVIHSVRKELAC